nr:hypothetical protein [Tanacetum cinerariifolium]
MDLKSKVLIIGGTGYLGKRLVKASLEQGHETYILRRPEIGVDIEKIQMLLGFKKQGARLVIGSFNDHRVSEFGTDPARMADAMEPGRVTFDDKMVVRKAIEEAGIPFTYVSANCFAGYMVGGLCQPGHILPSHQGYAEQVGLTHYYHVYYDGCLTNFEIGDDAEEACALYPDIEYIKVEDYLKQYL